MVVKATFEPVGAVAGLWVPCFVFGHLFAGCFLWRVLCMVHPRLVKSIKKKLFRRKVEEGKAGGASGTITQIAPASAVKKQCTCSAPRVYGANPLALDNIICSHGASLYSYTLAVTFMPEKAYSIKNL